MAVVNQDPIVVTELMNSVADIKARIASVPQPRFALDEFMDDASKMELHMKWKMNLFKFIATLLQDVLDKRVQPQQAADTFQRFNKALEGMMTVVG